MTERVFFKRIFSSVWSPLNELQIFNQMYLFHLYDVLQYRITNGSVWNCFLSSVKFLWRLCKNFIATDVDFSESFYGRIMQNRFFAFKKKKIETTSGYTRLRMSIRQSCFNAFTWIFHVFLFDLKIRVNTKIWSHLSNFLCTQVARISFDLAIKKTKK